MSNQLLLTYFVSMLLVYIIVLQAASHTLQALRVCASQVQHFKFRFTSPFTSLTLT